MFKNCREYELLRQSGAVKRREIADQYMRGIAAGVPEAVEAYISVVRKLLAETKIEEGRVVVENHGAAFKGREALGLISHAPRLRCFFKAIERSVGNTRTAVDVGTGPGAVLAMAVAVMSPKIEKVTAIEINPRSAGCAQKVIELFGLGSVVEVLEGNALSAAPIECDTMVTETFAKCGVIEQGIRIVQHYREAAGHCVPNGIRLRSGVFTPNQDLAAHYRLHDLRNWTDLGVTSIFDLGDHIKGSAPVDVRTARPGDLYAMTTLTDYDEEIIPPFADSITKPRVVKANAILPDFVGDGLEFRYPHSRDRYATIEDTSIWPIAS